MTDEVERKHDLARRADEHANAVLNAFNEIDQENRTDNAVAHPAFCRGIAPARRRLTTVYRPSVATNESRRREHTVARLTS